MQRHKKKNYVHCDEVLKIEDAACSFINYMQLELRGGPLSSFKHERVTHPTVPLFVPTFPTYLLCCKVNSFLLKGATGLWCRLEFSRDDKTLRRGSAHWSTWRHWSAPWPSSVGLKPGCTLPADVTRQPILSSSKSMTWNILISKRNVWKPFPIRRFS